MTKETEIKETELLKSIKSIKITTLWTIIIAFVTMEATMVKMYTEAQDWRAQTTKDMDELKSWRSQSDARFQQLFTDIGSLGQEVSDDSKNIYQLQNKER
jgi:septal ring factor EnvC (AmiA/AmiB activator)